jgi:DNA gyrase subunit B
LRADFGTPAASFVVHHRLVEADLDGAKDFTKELESLDANGHELSVIEQTDDNITIKLVERETGAASHVVVARELFASPVYANLRKSYARMVEIAGSPPFELSLGKKGRSADTFEGLRHEALDLAKEGIQVGRFKGLGEMNSEELWETTMNPANRMLINVAVDDAAAADRIFSMLMGDQVEPRREFIETNAKDVRFLDV